MCAHRTWYMRSCYQGLKFNESPYIYVLWVKLGFLDFFSYISTINITGYTCVVRFLCANFHHNFKMMPQPQFLSDLRTLKCAGLVKHDNITKYTTYQDASRWLKCVRHMFKQNK